MIARAASSAAGDGQRQRPRRLRPAARPPAAARRSGRWSRPRRRPPRRPAPPPATPRWRGCPGSPRGPVHAFAPPELSTTASTRPSASTCWDHSTGAALTRLLVNTPAAVRAGPSLTTTATSSSPTDFRPAATPAARKPARRGDAHWRTPATGSPTVSSRPRARLAFWTACPAAPLTRLSRALTTTARPLCASAATWSVHAVASCRGGSRRPGAVGQHVHERLDCVRRGQRVLQVGGRDSRREPRRRGGQDAARHRREHRRERQGDGCAGRRAQGLLHLRRVLVHSTRPCRRAASPSPRCPSGPRVRAGPRRTCPRRRPRRCRRAPPARPQGAGPARGSRRWRSSRGSRSGARRPAARGRPPARAARRASCPHGGRRSRSPSRPGRRAGSRHRGRRRQLVPCQAGDQTGGLAVRQGEEDEVGVSEGRRRGGDERRAGQLGQLRVQRGDRRTGAGAGGDRAEPRSG